MSSLPSSPADRDAPVRLILFCNGERKWETELDEELELGRQQVASAERGPFARFAADNGTRVVIAPKQETTIPRHFLRMRPAGSRQVHVDNISRTLPVGLMGGRTLEPGGSIDGLEVSEDGVLLVFGAYAIRLELAEAADRDLRQLEQASMAPVNSPSGVTLSPVSRDFSGASEEDWLDWMRNLLQVLQQVATSSDFLGRAAEVASTTINLDEATVFLENNGSWSKEADFRTDGMAGRYDLSERILNRVLESRAAVWQLPAEEGRDLASLEGVQGVVAAPILDPRGEVTGLLYGVRYAGERRPPFTRDEVMLFDLLAFALASGLARLRQEQELNETRTHFGQFFSPRLADQLMRDRTMLEGRDTEVTVLFSDVRGFSRISEQVSPTITLTWMNDVLGMMSDAVIETEGVLVDYVGDELMAMWGAPAAQSDHADRACRAALLMAERLPALVEKWSSEIAGAFGIGIGINTGTARVGNTGSRRKFKYGPLGLTVNMASRVQGSTKHIGVPILISESTYQALVAPLPVRRICCIQVVNIEKPVVVYELPFRPDTSWQDLCDEYELALQHYEQGRMRDATTRLGSLVGRFPDDLPTRRLLVRTLESPHPNQPGDVWKLDGK